MGKFIVEIGMLGGRVPGVNQDEHMVDAESRIDAEIAIIASHYHAGPRIVRLRAFPAKQDEEGAWVKDEQTCGNCGWLHPTTPQYAMGGPYDRDEPWCWATPKHCHRTANLPACACWKHREE